VRYCLYSNYVFEIYWGAIGGYCYCTRGRRLCHRLQRCTARRRHDGRDADWPALSLHPWRGGDRGTCGSPEFDVSPTNSFIQEESSLDVQKRITRQFYDTVEDPHEQSREISTFVAIRPLWWLWYVYNLFLRGGEDVSSGRKQG